MKISEDLNVSWRSYIERNLIFFSLPRVVIFHRFAVEHGPVRVDVLIKSGGFFQFAMFVYTQYIILKCMRLP